MQVITLNISVLMDEFQHNAENFLKGNAAAGRRARKNSIEIEKLLKEWRGKSTGRIKEK